MAMHSMIHMYVACLIIRQPKTYKHKTITFNLTLNIVQSMLMNVTQHTRENLVQTLYWCDKHRNLVTVSTEAPVCKEKDCAMDNIGHVESPNSGGKEDKKVASDVVSLTIVETSHVEVSEHGLGVPK